MESVNKLWETVKANKVVAIIGGVLVAGIAAFAFIKSKFNKDKIFKHN